jgi:hypothetical protein
MYLHQKMCIAYKKINKNFEGIKFKSNFNIENEEI